MLYKDVFYRARVFHYVLLATLLCMTGLVFAEEKAVENAQPSETGNQNNEPERYHVADHESATLDSFFSRFPKTLAEINDELRINVTKYGVSKIYYDTPDLSLLKKQMLLFFQKDDIKTYDESINNVFITMQDGQKLQFATKKYNRKISSEDKHPLLGRVKRGEREMFKSQLKNTGIDNQLALKKTITVHRKGNVINLYYKGYKLNLVIHDKVSTQFLGREHVENYLSIPQVKSTGIEDNEDIQLLLTIRGILVQTIQQNFTSLTPVDDFLQINPYETIGRNVPMMPFIIKHELAYKSSQAALFLVVLGLIVLLLRNLPISRQKIRKHTVYSSNH